MQTIPLKGGYVIHLTKNTLTIVSDNGSPVRSPCDVRFFVEAMLRDDEARAEGYRAGQEAMREHAYEECKSYKESACEYDFLEASKGAEHCEKRIRALPIQPEHIDG